MGDMQNIKDEIHKKLLEAGRRLVCEKGTEFLTARKLSEASGCSIGTIYNQFDNMDEFICEQNEITLSELLALLSQEKYEADSYVNLNKMADLFAKFVLDNRQLWSLLYNFHFQHAKYDFSYKYRKNLLKAVNFANRDFDNLFVKLPKIKAKTMRNILLLSFAGLSSVITSDAVSENKNIQPRQVARIFLNVFLAGTGVLEGL